MLLLAVFVALRQFDHVRGCECAADLRQPVRDRAGQFLALLHGQDEQFVAPRQQTVHYFLRGARRRFGGLVDVPRLRHERGEAVHVDLTPGKKSQGRRLVVFRVAGSSEQTPDFFGGFRDGRLEPLDARADRIQGDALSFFRRHSARIPCSIG
jgi:hypothetical protein